MGDPAGIGPDIALMAAAGRSGPLPPWYFIGDRAVMEKRARALGLDAHVLEGLVIEQVPCAKPVVARVPDSANAPAIIASIEQAVAAVHAGRASAVVTNPIAKHVLTGAGFKHPGHTEFLGEMAQRHWGAAVKPVMMLASPLLRVVLATIHVPLADVPRLLTEAGIVEVAETTLRALKTDFGIARPRLTVAGLNPHAGEAGTIGREEQLVIAPAIARLRAAGHDVIGPFAADSLFHPPARATYDAVLAMYHDQGLIPLKTLSFDEGVNVTLGLPYVRTSPDHGTAFGIAGTGRASPASFAAALRLADAMARRRAAGRVA